MRLLTLTFCTLLCCFLTAQAEPESEWESLTIPPGPTAPANTIQIRCCSASLNTEEPLYIINGYPAEKTDLNALDPKGIESISVLKDENALLLYGSRAANGVVIIRTKGKANPRADYTLSPQEIPADLFTLYETLEFGGGLPPEW